MEEHAIVGATESLARVVTTINGKGGVGKTSITANVAGQLAANDYKILAIDLDLSGNLALDLGYVNDERNDNGRGVLNAVWQDEPLHVITDVRPNLDVIPGGRQLEMMSALAVSPTAAADMPGGSVSLGFAAKLADIAGDYDLVFIDGAPGNPALQETALAAARYVVIPTKTDPAGWEGLRMIGPRVKKARKDNPLLTYLGVVLFGHSTNATQIHRATRARLAEVSDTVPFFETFIRHSEGTAQDCRVRGQLAHELARDVPARKREALDALAKARRENPDAIPMLPPALSKASSSLAGDYERLAAEMLRRINAHENTLKLAGAAR